MRRKLWISGLLLVALVGTGVAADYQVTVTIDAEGLRYLRRVYPGLDAEGLRAKVGEVCGQRIKVAGARDIRTRLDAIEQKYRRLSPADQATLAAELEALGD